MLLLEVAVLKDGLMPLNILSLAKASADQHVSVSNVSSFRCCCFVQMYSWCTLTPCILQKIELERLLSQYYLHVEVSAAITKC